MANLETEYRKIVIPVDETGEFALQIPSVFDSMEGRYGIQAVMNENKVEFLFKNVDFQELQSDDFVLAENPIFDSFLQELEKIRSYGLSGGRRNYIDYNAERKVKNRKGKVKKRLGYSDFAAKFPKENIDIPDEFHNKIICGDSEEILKKMPDNCVDIVFTSPPYNFGLDYKDHDDTYDWRGYFDKLFRVFEQCIRVLKYGGRIIVNIQPLFSDYIPSHHIISDFFFRNGLIWKGEILWEKNNYNCKYTAWGSWKSPSSPYLKYTWEYLEVFCKGDLKKEGSPENADITPDEFKKWVNAKWSIAPERNMSKYGHPAMFPEELAKRVIRLFSFVNDVVLDPFNGVGTTTYVAADYSRRYIGIDTSEEYCDTANKRLDKIKERLF